MPKYAKKRTSRKTLRRRVSKKMYKKKGKRTLKKTHKFAPEVKYSDSQANSYPLGICNHQSAAVQQPGYLVLGYGSQISTGTGSTTVIGRSYVITGFEAHFQFIEQTNALASNKIKMVLVKDKQPSLNVYSSPPTGVLANDPVMAFYDPQRFVTSGAATVIGSVMTSTCDRLYSNRQRFKVLKTKVIHFKPDAYNNSQLARNRIVTCKVPVREMVRVQSTNMPNLAADYYWIITCENGNCGSVTSAMTGTVTNVAQSGYNVNFDLRMKYIDP